MYCDYPTVFIDSMNHVLEIMNELLAPVNKKIVQIKDMKQVRKMQSCIVVIDQVDEQLEETKYLSLLVPI